VGLSEEVVGKADAGFYPKEKPGMGQALKGQLILTNRRLVYVRYLGGKYLTAKTQDYSDNIGEGLRNEGSFEVPLDTITEAKADRVWGTPYFRLRYRTPAGERACALVLVSSMNLAAVGGVLGLMKAPYDQLAKAIEQLKSAYNPASVGNTKTAQKTCPNCGNKLAAEDLYCLGCGAKVS
jgi:hypothetical protein